MAINNEIYKKLSAKAKAEFDKMVDLKENAFDMIVNNYFGLATYNSNDFCSRLHVEQFVLNPDMNSLQQNGKNGWWQNEANELSSVNENLIPIIETEGTVDRDVEKYYSSFALKEFSNKYNLRYPMDDDYTSSIAPFNNLSMDDSSFNVLVKLVQAKLGVKVNNGALNKKSAYKRAFGNLVLVKIKNSALKLVGRAEKAQTAFKGKIILASKTKSNYKFTNIEKTVKLYDELFKVEIAKQVKYSKGKYKALSKDVKFASRLYADILMSKVTDYGNPAINAKVEKCLSLQFANVLNRSALDSSSLKIMADLGVQIVADTCKRMGLTYEQIMEKMIANGYQYPQIPNNEIEAIMFATGKDYSKYFDNTAEQSEAKVVEEEKEVAPALSAPTAMGLLPSGGKANNEVIELGAPKISGHLNAGTSFVIVDDVKDAGKTKEVNAPKVEGLLAERASGKKFDSVKELYSGNMYNMKTISERLIEQMPEEMKKEQIRMAIERYKKAHPETKDVSKKTIAKCIDKVVIKLLSDKVVSINTKLNAHRYSKVGGKEEGQKASDIYSQVLSYYTNSVNTTKKVSEVCKENGTLYTRAKKVCDQIVFIKNKIVEAICDDKEVAKRNAEEPTVKFLNRKFKEISDYNIKDFFKVYIEKLPKIYGDFEKEDNQK